MPYPREIVLSEERETTLKNYLREEIVRHYFEREAMIEELKMWQNQYWAKPVTERRTFPFRGAAYDYVSQSRFLFPFTNRNVQLDAWAGEEHSNVPSRIKMMEDSGFFKPGTYEKLYAWVQQATVGTPPALARHYEREQEKEEQRESHWPRRLDWVEIWADFDVEPDGREEAIVVHFHYPSLTIMSCRYNWHEDLHRPYRTAVFQAVEGRWRGIGICKMNEQFQREITTMHRQRLDNSTMATMRMIKVHKLSGYGPNEPVFPGKMWFLEDMEHLEPIQMTEEYQSAFANEQ